MKVKYQIIDNGYLQHIVAIPPNQSSYTYPVYDSFRKAKTSLKESFQQTIEDYQYAIKELSKTRKADAINWIK